MSSGYRKYCGNKASIDRNFKKTNLKTNNSNFNLTIVKIYAIIMGVQIRRAADGI